MSLIRLVTSLVIATLGLISCSEPARRLIAPPNAEDVKTASTPTAGDGKNETGLTPRFSVALRAVGSLEPGAGIELRGTVRALVPTKRAEVSIVAPEYQLARANGWTLDAPLQAQNIPAVWSGTLDMGQGTATSSATITIERAGLYQVFLNVDAPNEPAIVNGQYVQNAAHTTIWLLVDDKGGRVLNHFDPTVIPSGKNDDHLGPWRDKNPLTVKPLLCTCEDCPTNDGCGNPPPPPPPPPPALYNVKLLYYNADHSGALEPVVNAYYEVYISGSRVTSGHTDENGSFSVTCPTNWYVIFFWARSVGKVNISSGNSQFMMKDWQTPTNPCATSNAATLIADGQDVAWLFTQMRLSVDSSRSFFQESRGELGVNYDGASTTGTPYYSTSDDHVHWFGSANYGDYGRFGATHEYGHALAEKSLSGSLGGACPSSGHYIDGSYNLTCAFSEGWADYHSVAARGPDAGFYYTAIKGNQFYHGGDGSIIEAPVASFLFDLSARSDVSDIVNGSELALHYPGHYVAEEFRVCEILPRNPPLRRTNGIDDFSYCLERRVDYSIETTYFQTRPYSTSAAGIFDNVSQPSTWNPDNIRRVWLRKLYGQ